MLFQLKREDAGYASGFASWNVLGNPWFQSLNCIDKWKILSLTNKIKPFHSILHTTLKYSSFK